MKISGFLALCMAAKCEQKCCRLQAAEMHQVTSGLVIRVMPKRRAAQRSLLRFLRILKEKVPGAPGRNKGKMQVIPSMS